MKRSSSLTSPSIPLLTLPAQAIDEVGESEEEGEEGEEYRSKAIPQARQGQQLLQPGVSQKAGQQLMYSLELIMGVMLKFLDELQEQGGGGGGAGGLAAAAGGQQAGGKWAGVQADLALGAVRVLGR
jgi:hypothetical protein